MYTYMKWWCLPYHADTLTYHRPQHPPVPQMNSDTGTVERYTVCVKKTFPKSFNSIPFRLAKMRTKPECNVAKRRPKSFAYCSVSFRFVRYRSVHSAENRAQSNGALILRGKAASPRSHVGMLWQPPGDEQKPREAFSKSGRSPRSLNLQRVRAPL